MVKDKLVLLFDGNCQAHHLAAVFRATGLAEAYAIGRDRGFIPSFRGILCRYIDENDAHAFVENAKSAGKRVIQVAQSTQMASEKMRSFSGLLDGVVRFPHLQCMIMNPGTAGIKVGSTDQIKRLYDLDLKTIERCQIRAGSKTDYAGLVREKQVDAPLFHSALHGGALLTSLLVKEVASQIGVDQRWTMRRAIAEIGRTEGINFITNHPMEDSVLSTLGFQWQDYDAYRRMILTDRTGDHAFVIDNERMLRRRFGHETLYWQAIMRARVAAGNFRGALKVSRVLERLAPGSVMTWFNRIDCERRAGADERRIGEVLHHAARSFGDNRQLIHLKSLVSLRLGRASAALSDAQHYFDLSDDLVDAIKPLLRSLMALGEVGMAEAVVKERARAIQVTERRRLAAAISDLPHIGERAETLCRLDTHSVA